MIRHFRHEKTLQARELFFLNRFLEQLMGASNFRQVERLQIRGA